MRSMQKIAVVEVLKIPAFRSLWLSQIFSQTAINLLTFVLALRVYHLTGINTTVSVLTLSFIVPQALFGLLAGVLVDRYDKKVTLFLCNSIRAAVVLLFLLTSEALPFIYLLAIFISLVTQFFIPAEAPIIPTIVSKKELLTANGVFTLTIFISMLAGGLLAGPLLDLFGLDKTFVFIFGMYLLASLWITQIPGQPIRSVLKRRTKYLSNWTNWANLLDGETIIKIKKEFLEGKDYILTHAKVSLSLSLLIGSQTVIASVSTLLPGLADKVLHRPVNDVSIMLLGPAILGIVLGTVVVSQFGKKLKLSAAIATGIIFVAINLTLLGLTDRLIFVQIFLFALGFSNALIDVSANTILQTNTAEEVRSRVYGVLTATGGMVFIIPVIMTGALSDFMGVRNVFFLSGVLIFILFFFKIRKRLMIL